MGQITNAPQVVEDAIFVELQQALFPAMLNKDRPENLAILLRWANEEYNKKLFTETSTPAQIAAALLTRVKQTPQSLIWDEAPDFEGAAKAEAARIKKLKDKERAAKEDAKFKPGIISTDDQANDNTRIQDRGKQDAEAKALAQVKSEIAREISSYLKGHHSGVVNYSATEYGQAELKKVAGNYSQLTKLDEAKRVLQQVKDAKKRLS